MVPRSHGLSWGPIFFIRVPRTLLGIVQSCPGNTILVPRDSILLDADQKDRISGNENVTTREHTKKVSLTPLELGHAVSENKSQKIRIRFENKVTKYSLPCQKNNYWREGEKVPHLKIVYFTFTATEYLS